eukprot:snap_masked-scaffold_28-processed-gene-4.57-mRNA-1 protein AED:1.00 eAED:1.00 QI:0/0/0/0/1/1/3/0/86
MPASLSLLASPQYRKIVVLVNESTKVSTHSLSESNPPLYFLMLSHIMVDGSPNLDTGNVNIVYGIHQLLSSTTLCYPSQNNYLTHN